MLRELLAKLGIEVDSKPLIQANAGLDTFAKKVGGLGGLFGSLAAAAGLGVLKTQIDEVAKESGELRAASLKAGVGFQEFQKLTYVTGLSAENLTTLFRKLQQNVAAASGKADEASDAFNDLDGGIGKVLGKKQAAEAFKALGVEVSEAGGQAKTNGQLFLESAQALAKIQNPAQRTALAMKLFGRSGQDLLPFLSKSPEAIAQLSEQFETFGGISDDSAAKLKEYGLANKQWALAARSVKIALVTEVVPAFTWIIQKAGDLAKLFKQNTDTSLLLKTAILALSSALIVFNAEAIGTAALAAAPWVLGAAAVALFIAILDDLVHFIKGDANTATEALIKLIFGEQAGESWIAQVRRDIHAFVEDLMGAKSVLSELKDFAGFVAGGGVLKAEQGILGAEDVQVASRGLTRKARRRGTAAAEEAGLGEGERVVPGPTLLQAGKSLYQPSEFYGPTLAQAGRTPTNQTNTVQQTNHNTFNVYGSDADDTAHQVAGVIGGVGKDTARAALAALEAQKAPK